MDALFDFLILVCAVAVVLGLIRPSWVIRWGRTRTRGRVVLVYGLGFVIVLAVGIPLTSGSRQRDTGSSKAPPSSAGPGEARARYEVLKEDIHDSENKTQVTLDILVDGHPEEARLRELLRTVHDEVSARTGFRHHDNPTHIWIRAFTSAARARSSLGGQWAAELSRIGSEGRVEINVNSRVRAADREGAVARLGLTDEKRRAVFVEIVRAEDRAQAEAERRYPLGGTSLTGLSRERAMGRAEQNQKLADQLTVQYKREIADRHGLQMEDLDQIATEGLTKSWPVP